MRKFVKAMIMHVAQWYRVFYRITCGSQPLIYPWHYQWHAIRTLNRDLALVLAGLEGKVLDFGCGAQPYRPFLSPRVQYTGVDVSAYSGGVKVIAPEGPLPFEADRFDAVLCTQVLEHVEDVDGRVAEMTRVLKPGGVLFVSVPFIFHLHGRPHDYRRWTEYGVERLFGDYEVSQTYRQGAIGSTLAVLLLGWIDHQTESSTVAFIGKVILAPLWIVFCLLLNMSALLLDRIDSTGAFYHNLLFVARKR